MLTKSFARAGMLALGLLFSVNAAQAHNLM